MPSGICRISVASLQLNPWMVVSRIGARKAGVIVVSGRLDEREEAEFKALGVNALIDKQFTQEKLVAALKTIFPA